MNSVAGSPAPCGPETSGAESLPRAAGGREEQPALSVSGLHPGRPPLLMGKPVGVGIPGAAPELTPSCTEL